MLGVVVAITARDALVHAGKALPSPCFLGWGWQSTGHGAPTSALLSGLCCLKAEVSWGTDIQGELGIKCLPQLNSAGSAAWTLNCL